MFWNLIVSFWYVWLIFAVAMLWNFYSARKKQARLAASGIHEIDQMDGRRFEQYLATLFPKLGYMVKLTPYQSDWGGDLVLQKGNVKTVVQAKRYSKNVGVRAVQEAVAAKAKYDCTEAMVVTNSGFTAQAQELARANHVELWGRQRLVQAILAAREKSTTSLHSASDASQTSTTTSTIAPAGTPQKVVAKAAVKGQLPQALSMQASPTCSICNKPVSAKVAAFCEENANRFGGRIYCFEHQKQVRSTRLQ